MFGFGKPGEPIIVKEMRRQISDLQNSVSILLESAQNRTTVGNPYPNPNDAIAELAKKYEGTAEWGIQQIRNIIDVRSAFIIGNGIKMVGEPDKFPREWEAIKQFIEYNNLDEEMPQEFAKEGEIEGRIAVRLKKAKDGKNITIRFISYSSKKYKVVTDPEDYDDVQSLTYKLANGSTDVVIKAEDFVYKKLAGRVDKVNDVMPKTAMVLRQCEDLDKSLWDWRKGNEYFARPTPYFKCTDAAEVKTLLQQIKDHNWKIGKVFVSTADFKYVEPTGSAANSSKEEIIMLAKIISGATGVPVHFLGLPDLMSNRAVSTDLFEFIQASTNKERHIWQGFYEELFSKVLALMNKEFKRNYNVDAVKCQLVQITDAQMRQLTEIWLPLYLNQVVTLDYMLSKIPDLDPDAVKEAMEGETDRLLKKIVDTEEKKKEKEPEPDEVEE